MDIGRKGRGTPAVSYASAWTVTSASRVVSASDLLPTRPFTSGLQQRSPNLHCGCLPVRPCVVRNEAEWDSRSPGGSSRIPWIQSARGRISLVGHAWVAEQENSAEQVCFHLALKLGLRLLPHFYRHIRSEEHTSELQSRLHLVCRLLLEKKKKKEIFPTLYCNGIRHAYTL